MDSTKKRSLADWKSTGEITLANTDDDQRRRLAVDLLDACDRVAELEAPQVGWVRCPECDHEHDVQLSRGRTNEPDQRAEPDPTPERPITVETGGWWCEGKWITCTVEPCKQPSKD